VTIYHEVSIFDDGAFADYCSTCSEI